MYVPRSRIVLALAALLALLLPLAAFAAPPKQIPGEILVKFQPGARGAERAAARASVNAQRLHDFSFISVEHLKVRGITANQAIERLRRNPNVVYAEPNYEIRADRTPNDPRFPEMWQLQNTGQTGGTPGADIKATNAWDVYTGDPNMLIGIIDTGVDYNHPDLQANIWTNPGEIPGNGIDDDGNGYVDDVHGYDFYNDDGDPFDDYGHGTHVAGTIAALGDNNVGVVGVNWHAKIVAMKFLGSTGSGSTAGAIASVYYAITVGVRLTSNSWGGGGFSQALLDAINAAGAAGQLFIAAAGNDSQNTDLSPHYPSAYDSPFIISVAATNHDDGLAYFSNYGATTVDLGAPGENILSTLPGNSYGSYSGTSMATPHVSGVAALTWGRYPALTNLQVKNLIMTHADPDPALVGKCVTGARLNAFMTIAEPDTIPPGMIADLSTTDPGSNTMGLTWTSTGDDGGTGKAARYEIRYSTSPITAGNWDSATPVTGPDPKPAGSAEAFEVGGLSFSTPYYFAIKAFDEWSNAGPVSNVAMGTTLGIPDITATPASFSAELLTGATETQTLTLRNDGMGTLDFTIPTPTLVFALPAPFPYESYPKDQPDVRVGPPVTDAQGGPDAFGYRWIDSNEPNGPAFDWVDITGLTSPVPLTGDDAISDAIPIGFDFPFYGTTFNTVRICTNGFMSFTDAAAPYDNQQLPNSGAPANLVAPFWDDLNFGTTPYVYAYYDGFRFIVSWEGAPHYSAGGPYTFQAILYPNGEIRYQYLSLLPPTNSATVGIQNGAKSIGLNVAFNTDYLQDNLAVRIVPLTQWLTVTPTSGRIYSGSSQDLQVRFNALGLTGGTYDANITVDSNDPDESPTTLPAHLHVIGAPDIAVSPESIDFGTVFVGSGNSATLTVSNPGTDDLVVTDITSDDAFVTASPTSFTLHPLQAQAVTVGYDPTAVRATTATLAVLSNDPDSPSKTVAVTGNATPAPSFSVTPTSLDVSLLTNTATTRTLTIANSGGSDYIFTAEAVANTPSGTVVVKSDADNVVIGKGDPDVQSGPQPLSAGGPDTFGYSYMDSDEPGGPAFSWVEIEGIGTQIPMSGDDQNTGTYPVGFDFPFYGNSFDTFRISTNGFVSFTSTLTAYSNYSIPNSASYVPENLLAVFWDDLNFYGVERAWYHNDGTRLIIEYKDAARYLDSSHPNTFEIILYPNGTILYQYLSMTATTKNSATIGIQNATKDDGLEVVYNANYVKDDLAIRFAPPARFLTVSPTAGTVPPGGSMNLSVGFNASGLFGGDYTGAVHISGNDPVVSEQEVACALHVTGVPDIAASPASIDFGNVFIGYPSLRQFTVQNVGTDVLHVTNVASTDLAYSSDKTSFNVPPLGSAIVTVSFNPPMPAGAHPATLTISSDDPDTPSYTISLSGAGIIPPDIDVSPTSMTATMPIPDTETQTVTISNTGGSPLNYVIGTVTTATSVAVYDELALGKEEVDPRPGILGSGGPDMYGYTWRDSDDPSGPAFDWVDITGIGTQIAVNGDDQNLQGVTIGFDFPYYGEHFNTVNVCSNGWLSFTSTSTSLSNQPLPNTGSSVPENLLAVFWDDLDMRSTSGNGRVYAYQDGTRFILSYIEAPRYYTHELYTFQVILYPSGRIVYQYLTMETGRLDEATIGIQNSDKTDGLTVVYNDTYVHDNLAIEIRALPEWMTATPTTGTIPALGSANVMVTFNSEDLFGGTYDGELRISSNDPDEGVVHLPCSLTAVGVPDITADPTALDFGTIYLSQSRDLPLTLRNDGSDVLTIQSLSITDGTSYQLVDPPTLPVSLGQRGALVLTVRFVPPNPCTPPSPCTSQVLVGSNDPDEGTVAVSLSGFALVPPEAVPVPASVPAALATTLGPTAIAKTKTLELRNEGGSDLEWTAEALISAPAAVDMTPSGETGKDQPGTPGEPTALANGGPDAAGYRWADSDDPAGPAFNWIDITAVGTPIPFTGDDQNLGPFPIPFPFPFYGNTFTEFRACTNGWLSFTSTLGSYSNTTLPNGTAPENLLAPYWDDLYFGSSGDAYYYYDGSKFIIEYVDAPRLGTGGPYTFEVILYPSGTIDFQYLDMQGTRLNEATIGIQNEAKDIGLEVVYNADYVKNNLCIRFSQSPSWLSVSPESGSVPAGEKADLGVHFNATGLADGDYSAVLRIASNDLTDPVIDIPCTAHVGVVGADFAMDPHSINRKSNGNWLTGYVEPMSGYDPHDILTSSILVNRTVPVAPNSPMDYGDQDHDGLDDVMYKFDRIATLQTLPDGENVPIEVIGELKDMTWFQGMSYNRVLRPSMVSAAGLEKPGEQVEQPILHAGTPLLLSWQDPDGYMANAYDVWFTSNGGDTWSQVINGADIFSLEWIVPAVSTQNARIEIAAKDASGIMGSWISPRYTIILSPTGVDEEEALPKVLSMRMKGANPMPVGDARLELSLPQAGPVTVRVFDVRGGLVRELVRRTMPAGRHGIQWDGRNASGAPVGSGVYFVRTDAGGKRLNLRIAVIR